ncbi:MAG TPA: hypothetical protein VMB21_04965 [Candidatus Limnocylindria bacterium]|jgi:hypothetical protein|nr:hypothetical protein [Candidatus Limnocylindria bacterium]
MKHSHLTLAPRFGALLALLFAASLAHAADANGKWTWVSPGRNGGPGRTNTLTLKVEGTKLTGNVSAPNREGKAVETAISEGKLDGDTVAFSVTREFNGNSFTAKYNGKLAADKITGKIEMTRNGEPVSRDWEAKRDTEAK